MTIMTRIVRLCRADIHGVVDQLENKGLLLKQYLRDMEKVLDIKESMLKKMLASRSLAEREYEKYLSEIENVEKDLKIAIERDKDNLARVFIKKLRPLKDHLEELSHHIKGLDEEIDKHEDWLKEKRLEHERLRLRSLAYFRGLERRQWERSKFSMIPNEISAEPSDAEIEIELLRRKEAIKGGKEK